MEAFVFVAHNMVKLIGILYVVQLLVGAFNWSARDTNVIYRLLRFLTSPVTRAVRAVTPAAVSDKYVPVVAFGLLFWIYIALIALRLYARRPELFQ